MTVGESMTPPARSCGRAGDDYGSFHAAGAQKDLRIVAHWNGFDTSGGGSGGFQHRRRRTPSPGTPMQRWRAPTRRPLMAHPDLSAEQQGWFESAEALIDITRLYRVNREITAIHSPTGRERAVSEHMTRYL